MKLHIKSGIDEYLAFHPDRWHTPGHKGELCDADITEIDDTFPGEAVINAQNDVAELLKSKYVRFSVGGSSMCIKAAVIAADGDILVAENSHRALFEAAKLSKVNAFTVPCRRRDGLMLPPLPQDIERALDAHPSVKAVYLTSPDYYGFCVSPKVAEVVKGRAYLFCDGAHGAHFAFRTDLFPPLIEADAINLSAHKTLNAYTQTAYLCVNNDELMSKIDDAFALLGTTSPSYVLLGSLEYAAKYAYEHRAQYDVLKAETDKLRECVPTVQNDDFTRVVVDANKLNMSGEELYFSLKSIGVVAEKFDERYVVFIVTLADTPQKINRLKEAICEVSL